MRNDADDYAGLPPAVKSKYTSTYQAETYELLRNAASGEECIRCRLCGAISANPNDVDQRYCGRCHRFHGRAL